MDVHLRDLRYFLAVAEHLHFGRAAEASFVSQPALSKQVRALETQLGVRLFDRDRRSVVLTPAGAAFLPAARGVLDAWESAAREVATAAAQSKATLTVGMSTGVGRGLLPAVRARFTLAVPHASLHLRQVAWSDPTGGLASVDGDIDAAFVWLPLPNPEQYRWITVATEPRRLLLPASHPAASRESVQFADLLEEPFLALPREAGPLRDYWLALDARDGRAPVIGGEIATTDETIESLAAGLGVCLVAAGNAHLFNHETIAIRNLSGVTASQLVLAWRRNDDRELIRHLIEATTASLASATQEGRPITQRPQ